jgi:hypothetical protein
MLLIIQLTTYMGSLYFVNILYETNLIGNIRKYRTTNNKTSINIPIRLSSRKN